MIVLPADICDFRPVAPGLARCANCGAEHRGERKAVRKCRAKPLAPGPLPAAGPPRPAQPWQEWREHEGCWIAVGFLQPGYAADPPQFDPLPGEVQFTPAFPVEDFR